MRGSGIHTACQTCLQQLGKSKKEKNTRNNKKINSITCNTGINIKLIKTNGIFGNREQF